MPVNTTVVSAPSARITNRREDSRLTQRFPKTISFLFMLLVSFTATSSGQTHSAIDNNTQQLPQKQLIILTSFSEQVSAKLASGYQRIHPEVRVRFLHKKTPAALTHLQMQMQPRPDLIMASAVDAMDWLSRAGQLQPLNTDDRINYTPFAYSGYGFMWHSGYLQQYQLDSPNSWQQLLQPKYQGHIAMSSPIRSGTTHVMVEMILQEKGWREGWAYIQQLAGNLATITARSFGVSQGIVRQRFGIGLVIDFFAFSAAAKQPKIGFSYSSPTTFLPVSIGIVTETPAAEQARGFVRYLLSDGGQKSLLSAVISRYPINSDLLRQQPEHILSQHRRQQRYTLDYDHKLAVRRYHLVNALFEYSITYRLAFLQRAWNTVYRLQKMPLLNTSVHLAQRLNTVISQLKQTPFSELQLTDSALLEQFSKPIPGRQLSKVQQQLQQQWQQWDQKQQDIVMRELIQLEAAVLPMDAP
ncbi:MAG: hypothetical protein OFPI_38730 [Osedax symbiont Rs2]|nr:MAG: hypothetical protein OFPI_38730 [Osedax symbiont Rs2]